MNDLFAPTLAAAQARIAVILAGDGTLGVVLVRDTPWRQPTARSGVGMPRPMMRQGRSHARRSRSVRSPDRENAELSLTSSVLLRYNGSRMQAVV